MMTSSFVEFLGQSHLIHLEIPSSLSICLSSLGVGLLAEVTLVRKSWSRHQFLLLSLVELHQLAGVVGHRTSMTPGNCNVLRTLRVLTRFEMNSRLFD